MLGESKRGQQNQSIVGVDQRGGLEVTDDPVVADARVVGHRSDTFRSVPVSSSIVRLVRGRLSAIGNAGNG
jgi:hypothetical protein